MKATNIIFSFLSAVVRVALLVLAVYVIYRGAQISYDYGYRVYTEPAIASGEGRTITVAISERMTPKQIGEMFENKGLVRDGKLFTVQYYLSEYRKDVKPGVYELSTSMTAEEMMAAMVPPEEEEESK